jgi:hypothetical protein
MTVLAANPLYLQEFITRNEQLFGSLSSLRTTFQSESLNFTEFRATHDVTSVGLNAEVGENHYALSFCIFCRDEKILVTLTLEQMSHGESPISRDVLMADRTMDGLIHAFERKAKERGISEGDIFKAKFELMRIHTIIEVLKIHVVLVGGNDRYEDALTFSPDEYQEHSQP